MKYLFLDTNVFLHYNSFEDIPWKELINDDFTIVITPIVQQELDKHKDQSREKIQKRARKMSSQLFDYLMGKKECRVPIARCKEPVPTEAERQLIDLSVNDNRIILAALHSGYNIEDIILVTGDKNNIFRAIDNKLHHLLLDDRFRLKPEKTEEEKRIEELEKQLKDATEKLPNPTIQFIDGSTKMVLNRYSAEDVDAIVEEKMATFEKDVPEIVFEETEEGTVPDIRRTMMVLQGTWAPNYNEERREYLEEEKAYQRLVIERDCLDKRFAKISFRLRNDGTAPTGEEKVFIKIPEHVKVYTWRESRERNQYVKPLKPGGGLAALPRETRRSLLNAVNPYTGPDNYIWMWNPQKPIDHEGLFKLSPTSVLQHLSTELGFEFFIDLQFEQSFEIQWILLDEYLPDYVGGFLSVQIND